LLWSWVFGVLVYWVFVSLPHPLSLGQVSDPSAGPLLSVCCDGLLIFLFFNFSVSFDFGYCSLAQEMSFVDHYLPYSRQWLITHLLSALQPFQPLFTKSSHRDQFLAPPSFSSVLPVFPHPCCVLVFSLLFIHFLV
jgi:hypothetical protein